MTKRLLGCTVALTALSAVGQANAAQPANASVANDAPDQSSASAANVQSAGAVGDIVVTARRREESLQKVPIAISAFNQDTLRERNVTSLNDLQNQAPALSTNSYNSRDALTISIRGVGQGTSGSPPGVLLYVNEIPIATDGFGQADLPGSGIFYDLQNVQVLRGPQGTLFGRNSVGGAVLFVTQKPTNDFSGYIDAGYGNYNNRQVEGAVNIPLIDDKLLVRFSGRYQKRDGYTRSLGTPSHPDGENLDDTDAKSGRVSVTFKPDDRIEDNLVVLYAKSSSNGQSLLLSGVDPNGLLPTLFPQYITQLAQQKALGVRTVLPTSTDFADRHSYFAVTNSTNVKLSDDITFRNIFGYSYGKSLTKTDNDSTNLEILDGDSLPDHVRQYTEEVQLQGQTSDGKLNWVGGLFYLNSPELPFSHFRFDEFFVPSPQDLQRGERSKAVYAQATYQLFPGLKATAGFRYTWDTRFGETRNLSADGTCPSPPPAGENANCGIALRGKYHAPTWNVSLDYQVDPKLLVYVASRRGYRSGGFNFLDTSNSGLTAFRPEQLTDGEVGTKFSGRIAGVPATLNSDFFYEKYKDIQVQQIVFDNNVGQTVIRNAAAAKAYGFETEGSITPVHGVHLGAYFNWLDFKYTNLGPDVDLSYVLDQRPEFKYGLNGDVTIPLNDSAGSLRFNASWGWTSYTGDRSLQGSFIPSRGDLNVGAQWSNFRGLPIDISFFMTNALNGSKLVRTVNLYNLVGISQGSYEEPRMYGVRLRYHFGGA